MSVPEQSDRRRRCSRSAVRSARRFPRSGAQSRSVTPGTSPSQMWKVSRRLDHRAGGTWRLLAEGEVPSAQNRRVDTAAPIATDCVALLDEPVDGQCGLDPPPAAASAANASLPTSVLSPCRARDARRRSGTRTRSARRSPRRKLSMYRSRTTPLRADRHHHLRGFASCLRSSDHRRARKSSQTGQACVNSRLWPSATKTSNASAAASNSRARRWTPVTSRSARSWSAATARHCTRTATGSRTATKPSIPNSRSPRWAVANLTPEERARATVYTSGEHCPMCAAGHAWVGLAHRLATSSAQLAQWRADWVRRPRPSRRCHHDHRTGASVTGPVAAFEDEMKALYEAKFRP